MLKQEMGCVLSDHGLLAEANRLNKEIKPISPINWKINYTGQLITCDFTLWVVCKSVMRWHREKNKSGIENVFAHFAILGRVYFYIFTSISYTKVTFNRYLSNRPQVFYVLKADKPVGMLEEHEKNS